MILCGWKECLRSSFISIETNLRGCLNRYRDLLTIVQLYCAVKLSSAGGLRSCCVAITDCCAQCTEALSAWPCFPVNSISIISWNRLRATVWRTVWPCASVWWTSITEECALSLTCGRSSCWRCGTAGKTTAWSTGKRSHKHTWRAE